MSYAERLKKLQTSSEPSDKSDSSDNTSARPQPATPMSRAERLRAMQRESENYDWGQGAEYMGEQAVRGAGDVVSAPDSISDLQKAGQTWLANKVLGWIGGEQMVADYADEVDSITDVTSWSPLAAVLPDSQEVQEFTDSQGLTSDLQPQNDAEAIVGEGVRALPSFLLPGGAAKATTTAAGRGLLGQSARALAPKAGSLAKTAKNTATGSGVAFTSGASGEVAAQGAEALGANDAGQTAARVAGGLLGPAAAIKGGRVASRALGQGQAPNDEVRALAEFGAAPKQKLLSGTYRYSKQKPEILGDLSAKAAARGPAPGQSRTPMQLGQDVQSRVPSFRGRIQQEIDTEYRKLDELLGSGHRVQLKNTQQVLKPDSSIAGDVERATSSKAAKDIAKIVQRRAANGVVDYEDAKKLRSYIGRKVKDARLGGDMSESEARRLYGALSEDIKSSMKGKPEALQQFERANSKFKQELDFLDNFIDKLAKEGASPETVFRKIMKDSKVGSTQLQNLKKVLSDSEFNALRQSQWEYLGRKGMDSMSDWDAKTFLKNYRQLAPETRDILFSGQKATVQRIQRAVDLVDNPNSFTKEPLPIPGAGAVGNFVANRVQNRTTSMPAPFQRAPNLSTATKTGLMAPTVTNSENRRGLLGE